MNMVRAQQLGWGTMVAFTNLTANSLTWAINEVLNNPNYEKSVEKIGKRLNDQPQTPMERAIFWIEYVLRHDGATFMQTSAQFLNPIEYNNLDVYAVFGIIILLVISIPTYLSLRTLKYLLSFFKSSKFLTEEKRKKKRS
jgi:glucuronosyltransferase